MDCPTCGPATQSSPSSPAGSACPPSRSMTLAMVLGMGWPHPPSTAPSSGWKCDTGEDSVMPKPSRNLITLGAAFSMNFSMRAGPKGAAPPVTLRTEARSAGRTLGWVARKLTSGGTRFSQVGLYFCKDIYEQK